MVLKLLLALGQGFAMSVGIDKAITKAKSQNGPTMIEVKTIIGYGAPNVSGTNGVHGAPLGSDEKN